MAAPVTEIPLNDGVAEHLEKTPEQSGKFNVYTCEKCKSETAVVLRDSGTTPFIILCTHEGCGGPAQSGFYRVAPDRVAFYSAFGTRHMFIRPSKEELEAYWLWEWPQVPIESLPAEQRPGVEERTLEHIQGGGLILVPTGDERWKP